MKILMVSIFAPHFFNWTEQLKDSGHEIFWLDVFDSGDEVPHIDFAQQVVGWRYRVKYPGRYYLKKKMPTLTRIINLFNERDLRKVLEEKLTEIKPDLVHSFVMYLATAPIFEVMRKYPTIPWAYSSWGSDLYYYRKHDHQFKGIKETLPEIDYLFTDCQRDHEIALENGFRGKYLGVFPGGGGYDFTITDPWILPFNTRNKILVKGYQGLHGKCKTVLQALIEIKNQLAGLEIVVFGADQEVVDFVKDSDLSTWENLQVLERVPQEKVMRLMGASLLYIGNSTSDGTPNTLLEAFIMGAYPIQSNPGGATAEWIQEGINGSLIENPSSEAEISRLVKSLLKDRKRITEGANYNLNRIKPKLERRYVREKVLEQYSYIEKSLNKGKWAHGTEH